MTQKIPSRKKFLLWSAVVLSSATVLKFLTGSKKKTISTETVKMLTQDGKLVEINKELLASSKKKISSGELQQWIKR
jgi:hypothetical protein